MAAMGVVTIRAFIFMALRRCFFVCSFFRPFVDDAILPVVLPVVVAIRVSYQMVGMFP